MTTSLSYVKDLASDYAGEKVLQGCYHSDKDAKEMVRQAFVSGYQVCLRDSAHFLEGLSREVVP